MKRGILEYLDDRKISETIPFKIHYNADGTTSDPASFKDVFLTEDDINWELIKDKAKSLSLNNDGQIITLPKECEYIQGKTASAIIGANKINIESRFIGFSCGNKIVKIRVDEKTNNISVEVVDDPNHIHHSKPNKSSD